MYGTSDIQSNNIEKQPSHKCVFFFNLLGKNLLLIRANNHNLALIIAEKFTKKTQHS